MFQTFHWSETRIAAYLQAEGEAISPQDVKSLLEQAYYNLDFNLPEDIKAIYFNDDMEEVSTGINQFLRVPKEPQKKI